MTQLTTRNNYYNKYIVGILALVFWIFLITAVQADTSYKSYFDYQDVNLGTTQRMRLLFNPTLAKDIAANIQYELSAHINDNLSSPAIKNQLTRTKPYYLGLDNVIASNDLCVIKQRVDRLNLKWHNWTIGREAVSFGVGRIWSPNDLFEPFAPTEIDKSYKVGIDVIKYDQAITDMSDVTVLYAPVKDSKGSCAGRLRGTFAGFATSFIAAKIEDSNVYGISFDGPIKGAGFRGSANCTLPPNNNSVYEFILGSDYMFPNDLYIVGEYYYNGSGSQNLSNYDWTNYLNGDIFNMAQHYLALGYDLSFWSLWNSNGYVISNLDDGSRLFWEEINYSLSDDSTIKSGVIISSGGSDTEYASFSSLVYTLLSVYF